jgi:carbonyl reductase 1
MAMTAAAAGPSLPVTPAERAAAKEYLREHNVAALFEGLAAQLIDDRPEDPLAALRAAVGARLAAARKLPRVAPADARTILVTGANKGIGYEAARQLAALGHRVVVGCRDQGRADAAVAEMQAAATAAGDAAPTLTTLLVDLDDAASLAAAADRFKAQFPAGLDVLLNNAGLCYAWDSAVPPAEQFAAMLATNYAGTRAVCAAFFPLLADGGRVVNVASRAAMLQYYPLYAPGGTVPERFSADDITVEQIDALAAEYAAACDPDTRAEKGWIPMGYGVTKAAVAALTRIQRATPRSSPSA